MDKIVNGKPVPMTAAEVAEFNSRPVPVPASVTRAQLRLALLDLGNLDGAVAKINAMPRRRSVEWDCKQTFSRTDPIITDVATAMGFTATQIDDLFKRAAAL